MKTILIKLVLLLLVLSSSSGVFAIDSVDYARFQSIGVMPSGDVYLTGDSLGIPFVLRIDPQRGVTPSILGDKETSDRYFRFFDGKSEWAARFSHLFKRSGENEWNRMDSIEFRYLDIFQQTSDEFLVASGFDEGKRGTRLSISYDGGQTWESRTLPVEGSELKEIHFFNSQLGMVEVFEEPDHSYYTTLDSGKTWNKIDSPKGGWWAKFRLLGGAKIIAAGDSFYVSQDYGKLWKRTSIGTGQKVRGFYFLDDSTGWAWGTKLWETKDRGTTWREIPSRGLMDDFEQIVFRDSLNGWAIRHTNDKAAFFTEDGGKSWKSFPDKWKNEIFRQTYKMKFEGALESN